MIEITQGRHNHLIDPHLEIWGWQISAYLFLGGLVAGLMILNAVFRLKREEGKVYASRLPGAILAPILLSIGMFFLWIDLSYKTHVYNFYLTFQFRSPMSWGAWVLILVYPAQILALALPGGINRFGKPLAFINPFWNWLKQIAGKIPRTISVLNIILGIMLGIYTGVLLSTFAARPLWNTALLPPLFIISGISTATALIILLKPTETELKSLIKWDVTLIAAELLVILLIIISFLTGQEAQRQAAMLLLGGKFTHTFWIFVITLGLALPLWLEIREILNRFVPAWVAPTLILLGGFILRLVLVYAGQHSHLPQVELLINTMNN